jgi:hypothetical protein
MTAKVHRYMSVWHLRVNAVHKVNALYVPAKFEAIVIISCRCVILPLRTPGTQGFRFYAVLRGPSCTRPKSSRTGLVLQ